MSEHKPDLKDPFPFLFSKAAKLDDEVDALHSARRAWSRALPPRRTTP